MSLRSSWLLMWSGILFIFLARNKSWMLNNSHICFDLFARNVFVASHGGTVGSERIHTPLRARNPNPHIDSVCSGSFSQRRVQN